MNKKNMYVRPWLEVVLVESQPFMSASSGSVTAKENEMDTEELEEEKTIYEW